MPAGMDFTPIEIPVRHCGSHDTFQVEMEPDLIRIQSGDLDAFEELVRAHEGAVRAFLRARIRDWASADDLAQDVFVTAFQRIRQFRGESSIGTWLRGIAMNHLRNFVRKRREECIGGSEELQAFIDGGATSWCGDSLEPEALEVLRECLERIDGPSRTLLHERYGEGRTVRELADQHDRGYSALTMQLHRLREVLAECVKFKLGDSPS